MSTETSTGRQDPFAGVRLRVSSLEKSVKFYTEVLGMQQFPEEAVEVSLGAITKAGVKSAYVGYSVKDCVYQLIEDESLYVPPAKYLYSF